VSDERYLKSTCTVCDGHIEFPADAVGAQITCPHCGGKTVLTVNIPPPLPASAALIKGGKKGLPGKSVALAAVLLILVGGGLAAFLTFSKHGGSDDKAPKAAPTPGQNSDANAAPGAGSPTTGTGTPDETGGNQPNKGKGKEKNAAKNGGLEVAKFEIQKAGKGSVVYVVGRVVNHDAAQYFKLKVEFNLFKKGKPAGQCSDRLPNLAPNGTWDFKALILEDGVDEARVATIEGEKE
jgi:hypothetical protein